MEGKRVAEVAAGPDVEAGDHLHNCLHPDRVVDAKLASRLYFSQ